MEQLQEIISHFKIPGSLLEIEPYGTGHINETYASTFRSSSGFSRFIHQRINHHVFKQPWKVMANIERILDHIRQRLVQNGEDAERGCLTLVPTLEGTSYCQTSSGDYWRTYKMIEGARTYNEPSAYSQVYEAAFAFGKFQRNLSNMRGEPLYETIPGFHNTTERFREFISVLEKDTHNRASKAEAEIQFILEREPAAFQIIGPLENGTLPRRITHNDTKLNNVLIDDQTGKGVCVIDLDTVMPGSALYDFGDMVRAGAANSAEDEPDIRKAGFNELLFEHLVQGYLDSTEDFLTPEELDLLAFSGIVITLEQGVRFLTDFLQGDQYYRIQYPDHNLVRCRTQIKLISDMEQKQDKMESIIRTHLNQ